MTKKYWKTLKKLSLTMLITMLFLVSISIPMNIQPNNTIFNNTDSPIVELPNASLLEYENPIYGTGNNRTLRTFVQNSSEASGVSKFNISSDSNDEFLNKGQYNFTFDKSYNTIYTLEDDTPFVFPDTDFTGSSSNEEISNLNTIYMQEYDSCSGLNSSIEFDDDINFIDIDSTLGTPNVVKFDLTTEFSDSDFNNSVVGFIIQLKLKTNYPTNLDISLYDLIET